MPMQLSPKAPQIPLQLLKTWELSSWYFLRFQGLADSPDLPEGLPNFPVLKPEAYRHPVGVEPDYLRHRLAGKDRLEPVQAQYWERIDQG
jgi:hypothetical protein